MQHQTENVGDIIVGKKDVDMTLPSHVPGVHEGNWPKRLKRTSGIRTEEVDRKDAATRSTGINPHEHYPIDPRMPKLTPP
jgi:hypothetical protein